MFVYIYLYQVGMSDQFSFQEVIQGNWLNDASRFTEKHLQTLSEVSKQHFLQYGMDEQLDNNGNLHNKNNVHLKDRNKHNAKNYRDRKKNNIQAMKRQIQHLHQENTLLRNQKYCRWCQRSFLPNVLIPPQTIQKVQNTLKTPCNGHQSEIELEFQKPELYNPIPKQKNPKIWIALGILLLVLGLTMHGLNGDKTYISKIQLEREEMTKWMSMIKEKDKGEYFEVSMRMKEETRGEKDRGEDINLHFTDLGEKKTEKEKVSINKELLMVIQAELDDIGVYL